MVSRQAWHKFHEDAHIFVVNSSKFTKKLNNTKKIKPFPLSLHLFPRVKATNKPKPRQTESHHTPGRLDRKRPRQAPIIPLQHLGASVGWWLGAGLSVGVAWDTGNHNIMSWSLDTQNPSQIPSKPKKLRTNTDHPLKGLNFPYRPKDIKHVKQNNEKNNNDKHMKPT